MDIRLTIDLNVRLVGLPDIAAAVVSALTETKRSVDHMSQQMDDLTAKVHANTAVTKSALDLIQGIAARLAAAGTDPAALAALSAELDASDQSLAAAVAANTPAAEPPPAADPPADPNPVATV